MHKQKNVNFIYARLTIATLNVNTLKTEEREEELNIALENVHYDIIGLCEIRRLGEAIIEKDNGDIFCYKGETKGQRGVGFLIKNKLKHMITEIVGVSERIMILKLEASNCKITIIQIYAPQKTAAKKKSRISTLS